MGLKERLFGDPGFHETIAAALRFFRQADDPEAFREALAEGDYERAADLADTDVETLDKQGSELRMGAEEVARRHDIDDEDAAKIREDLMDP